ncbi:unnamed protein product [Calicophoron daubneyi]|uniref:Uncharacterized protein n=1 Tax=Calicophoron daubneyi TaxID=300641 RepID=A0AAV2TRN5_CALDB
MVVYRESIEKECVTNLTKRDLPNSPVLSEGAYSRQVVDLICSRDSDLVRGALKALLFEYGGWRSNSAGIGQGASWRLFIDSKIVELFSEVGLPAVDFSGLHNFTFCYVASQRLRMSPDLYIDRFLPKLVESLNKQAKFARINTRQLTDALIIPLFKFSRGHRCKPKGNIVVAFTSFNRGFFTRRIGSHRCSYD